MKPKIRIIACADNFHFIQDLIPALSDEFDIKALPEGSVAAGAGWKDFASSDLLWLEWADGKSWTFLGICSRSPNLKNTKVLLRLHRYELFTPRTLHLISELPQEYIDRIDKLVFVSKAVQEIGIKTFPWMKDSVVVPNLIDHTKFPFTDRERGFNIMMLGRMSYVKNLPLALSMFQELCKIDSRYRLHIVGEISEPELLYYLDNFLIKTTTTNIRCHGKIDNDKLPKFMEGMHYLLCASVFESQGMGILEAMCCGLKPVVFDFPGAENMFPAYWRWINSDMLEYIVDGQDYNPIDYHNWAVNNYSIEKNIHLYKNLINGVLHEKTSEERIQTNLL